jgi:hypothetical protein
MNLHNRRVLLVDDVPSARWTRPKCWTKPKH